MTLTPEQAAAIEALSPPVRRAAALLIGGLLGQMADGRPDWGGLSNAAWKALEALSPEAHELALEVLDRRAGEHQGEGE